MLDTPADAPPGPSRPRFWPHFRSPLRSTAVTARLGRLVGIAFLTCFVTGLLSHYQYGPWSWLPEPASPVWGYRLTQGLHVATGVATIPLLLVKLWSVYPNLYRWPVVSSLKQAAERASVGLLVSSALVQLTTGFLNTLGWYPWPWGFVDVHRYLSYVVIGSILLHVAIKLPDIRYGLQADLAEADVLTEVPWEDNPQAHSNAGPQPAPPTPALTRRGLLLAAGAGVGTVVVTTVGQTLHPLEPLGLLATRRPTTGPQGVPINRTAEQAGVQELALAADYRLQVVGATSFELDLAALEALVSAEASLPITCVEGWSVGAHWRGVPLLELVTRAGGDADSRVRLTSLQTMRSFGTSEIFGPQLRHALLATHLNGERLNLDHGYPVRLIAPNRAGVLNTKWLSRLEVS